MNAIRPSSEKLKSALFPIAIFATNLAICWRYLRMEYTDQLPSIEGVFIALEQYIQRHWPTYDWFPMWFGGMPFTRVYQPGLHYATAIVSENQRAAGRLAYRFWPSVP